MAFQIKIDGPIGGEINKQFITNELEKANGEDIDLKISSLGGSVDDAFAIHDSLKDYSGHVKAIYTGFVASAATIIGAGADEGEMSPNALFLVHKSLSGVMVFGHLNEEDIDKLINDLNDIKNTNKKVDLIIANIYAQSTGRKAKTMLNLMSENKWLNAEETRDFGFIDNISHPEKKKKKAEVLALVAQIEKENLPKLPDSFINNNTMEIDHDTLVEKIVNKLKDIFKSVPEDRLNEVAIEKAKELKAEFQTTVDEIEKSAKKKDSENELLKEKLAEKTTEVENLTKKVTALKSKGTNADGEDSEGENTNEPTLFTDIANRIKEFAKN